MLKLESLFVIGACLLAVVAADGEEPNYEFVFDKIEQIDGTDQFGEFNYTLDKQSDYNYVLSGNLRAKKTLDDSYSVHLLFGRAELGSDEFETMFSVDKPTCEYMKTIYRMYFYDTLKDFSNCPHYDNCPLAAPADYWLKDYLFEGESYKAFTRDGHYRVEFYLVKDGVKVAGIITQMSVKPVEKR